MADYRVAVELLLVGDIVSALARVSRAMLGIRTQQREVEAAFHRWHGALKPLIGLLTSGLLIKGFVDVAKSANKVTDELLRMQAQGQKAADIQKNLQEAWRISAKTGQPVEQVLSEMGKTGYFMGGDPEATKAARELAMKLSKMETFISFVTGKEREGLLDPIKKILEESGMLGAGREKDLALFLEQITQGIAASKGAVLPAQIGQNVLYGRAARYAWMSPEALDPKKYPDPFVTTVLPYLIQSFGGMGRGGQAGPGAALMSMFTKNIQGTLTRQSAQVAKELGILEGARGRFQRGHLAQEQLYEENPYEWVQRVLWPALKAQGTTSLQAIIATLSRLYGTRAAADPAIAMTLMGRGRLGAMAPIEREIRARRRAAGIEEGFAIAQESPTFQMDRLKTEWANLWKSIGVAFNPTLVALLREAADAIQSLGEKVQKVDPKTIAAIGDALLGLAAGLGAASIIRLAAFAGLPGLIIGLGTAAAAASPEIRALAADGFEKLKIGLAGLADIGRHASAGLEQVLTIFSDFSHKVVRAVEIPIANALRSLGFSIPAITPWHDERRGPLFGAGGLQPVAPPLSMPGLPPGWRLPPGMGGGVPPWMEPIPQGPPPSLKDWRSGISGIPPVSPSTGISIPGTSTPLPPTTSLPFDFGRMLPQAGPTGGGLLHRQSWEPSGGGGGTVQINNVIYLDGQAVANAVHQYSMADLQHPRQAPMFDGRAGYTPPDSASGLV